MTNEITNQKRIEIAVSLSRRHNSDALAKIMVVLGEVASTRHTSALRGQIRRNFALLRRGVPCFGKTGLFRQQGAFVAPGERQARVVKIYAELIAPVRCKVCVGRAEPCAICICSQPVVGSTSKEA